MIVTADHRCLKALATSTACANIYQRLQGRVICYEQVLLRILKQAGYAAIHRHAATARTSSQRWASLLLNGDHTTQAVFEDQLRKRVRQLYDEVGHLLANTQA